MKRLYLYFDVKYLPNSHFFENRTCEICLELKKKTTYKYNYYLHTYLLFHAQLRPASCEEEPMRQDYQPPCHSKHHE